VRAFAGPRRIRRHALLVVAHGERRHDLEVAPLPDAREAFDLAEGAGQAARTALDAVAEVLVAEIARADPQEGGAPAARAVGVAEAQGRERNAQLHVVAVRGDLRRA